MLSVCDCPALVYRRFKKTTRRLDMELAQDSRDGIPQLPIGCNIWLPDSVAGCIHDSKNLVC